MNKLCMILPDTLKKREANVNLNMVFAIDGLNISALVDKPLAVWYNLAGNEAFQNGGILPDYDLLCWN